MAADVLKNQPGLLGDATRPGLQTLSRLVTDAEAALQAGHLQLAQSCLDTYFADTRRQGPSAKPVSVDQFACRAHFAAGQLISKLSSSYKGKGLVDAVLEAVDSIMRGVEIAAANPRYPHLVYNGSVHYWHVARPLQCDKLRHHLLPSQEKLCQALEKVEGQQAWRVRHLLSLALCQGSEEGKPEEVPKTLAKALELATAANLQPLRAEALALQTHHQTVQASKTAAGKPGGAAGAGKGTVAAAPAPPAAPKQAAAPAGKRKPGEPAVVGVGKADVDWALALLQWVLSAKPDGAVAEQQLQAAVKLVDIKPDKPGSDAHLFVVARIGWAAAVSGATQLAEQCTRRAATSQELGPSVWADLTRLLLSLKAAPEAKLGAGSDSSGSSAALDAAALKARREVLDGADEAASAFLKLGDVEGIHNAAVLAWNAGLPLLQPSHRSLVRPAFTAVAKALEAVGSPWTKLRAALHLEVAKAEADADSFMKAAKEVSTALSLNYPSSADMAAVCGYERPLDRYLEPMARAAQLRGVAPMQLSSSSGGTTGEAAVHPDDDVVLLLERAKDSKSAPLRSDYMQKAVNKLSLLPALPAPPGPANTDVLQQQLRAARTRTQLWADVVELAWRPCQLDAIVRSAVPFVLEPNWQSCGDKEMLVLQARMALVGAEAAKVALSKLDAELVVPPGYTPSSSAHSADSISTGSAANTGPAAGVPDGSKGSAAVASQKKGQEETAAEVLQRLVADYLLQSMQLSGAAGDMAWLLMNAAMAAWNTYLPLLQKERYADLAGLLLPVLKALLQEPSTLQPNQLVMLAEAAAKAAEHVALLNFLQLQQERQQNRPHSVQAQPHSVQDRPQSVQQQQQQQPSSTSSQTLLASALPWYKPLAEARAATAGLDVTATLAGAPDVLQLLSDTAAACQTALTRAATAAEPQGLIQSYARLQQLQGKPVTVLPGAPASMADTSKLLVLIEALTAAAPSTGAPAGAPAQAASAAGVASGRAGSAAPGGPAAAKPLAAGGKGAPATPGMSKAEQDIRSAMALLTAMPTVNLQLWAQLSRAAGWHGYWLLARDCANAALGALPADTRDLAAVTAASEVPDLGAQGWYWLSVAEMQQGQAVLSLLPSSGNTAACSLSLQHSALQHFATAVRLASFIRRADLAEAAARLAHNTVIAPGGLLETDLTRAAAVKELTTIANSLNAARPAEISFQVRVNLLLLECLSAAGRWQEARRHIEALHRSLPIAKQRGPAAAAALEAIASWRATCLVKASTRALEEMPRLLSELNIPQAKARAWLAFAQATPSTAEQLQARQLALAALDTLPPEAKVEYQVEFAEWLASCSGQLEAGTAADTPPSSPEQLLSQAVSALENMQPPGSLQGCKSGISTATVSRGLPSTADRTVPATAAAAGAGRHARSSVDSWGGPSPVSGGKRLEQLLRAHVMLSQVAADAADRRHHVLQAQACAEQLLTSSLLAAGAGLPPLPYLPEDTMAVSASGEAITGNASHSTPCGVSPTGATPAAAGADLASSARATVAAPAATKQPAVPALPLPMLTRPGTSATAAAGTARPAMSSRGIAKASQLPSSPLEWATWQPDAAVVEKLKELAAAADANSIQSTAGSRSRPGSVQTGAPGSSTMQSAWGLSCAQAAVALGRSCMQAPELLLANLRLLSEQLQASGCHVAALPVLHLVRLVALVTLGSEAEAAVTALQLSSVCEQFGLSAAAVDWLQLAAPERWPSPEQQQQAEASKAVQQLSKDVLLAHSKRMARLRSSRPQSASGSKLQTEEQQLKQDQAPDSMAFLLEALNGVEPGTLQSWMRVNLGSSEGDSSSRQESAAGGNAPSTWGSRVGSAQGRSRPASAPGARAAAAAAALSADHAGSLSSSIDVLKVQPTKLLDSWVSIARYLVDHAQYTAGRKLCSVALEMARSSGDTKNQAEVLLLQARLELLAQHFEDAVKLSQAAQGLGGGVQLWRDSVLCYAAARGRMAGRGPADALDALEGGVALIATVARGHAPAFKPTLLQASAHLKLHLAQQLESRAQQQLSDAQRDPSCFQAAAQQHCRAIKLCKEAAGDAQQAGAVLLQVQALQTAAGLLVNKEHAVIAAGQQQQQVRQQTRQGSRCGTAQRDSNMAALLPTGQAAASEAVGLLEAAVDALAAVPDGSHSPQLLTLCSRPTTSQMMQRTDAQLFSGAPALASAAISSSGGAAAAAAAAATAAATATVPDGAVGQTEQPNDASLPTARAAASVLVQLSEAELLAARLELQEGKGGKAALEPEFPRVDGRDPQAVIAYLSAAAADGQAAAAAKVDYISSALQHAQQAAEAAAAASQISTHAAALLALGKAHVLQAHAAVLEQRRESGVAFLHAASNSGGHSSSETDMFDAAWLPWPGQLEYSSAQPAVVQAGYDSDASAESALGASGDGQVLSASGAVPASAALAPAVADAAAQGGDLAATQQPHNLQDDSLASTHAEVQLPPEAVQPYQQALQVLQEALQVSLQLQQLATAEAAARALAHCYGQLQPEQTAWYLAVAQSCSSAGAMRGSFEQAAALQHAEVLLWRQLQQLERCGGPDPVHKAQVQQLLSLLGITSKRLQVPYPTSLKPVLSQLQQNQRLLMLHHDSDKQQLILAAWGVPGAQLSTEAQAALALAAAAAEAAAAAVAAAATVAGTGTAKAPSASGGAGTARGRKSAAAGPTLPADDPAAIAAAAAATAAAAVPPAAVLASMPCSQQQLSELTAAFAAYSKALHKAIVQATSQPVPIATADTAAAAAATVTTSMNGAKKGAGGAAAKGAAKDKGVKDAAVSDVPSWVPPTPVFPQELNQQWQQLMQQFELLLQPVSALLQDTLKLQLPPAQPAAAQAPAKQGKATSSSGGKTFTAASAASAQPVPISLQLLVDPALCELPWEALPIVRHSCGSIARCLSLAQLQQLLVPPQTLLGLQQQQQLAVVDAGAEATQPVGWDVGKLSYLLDPLHHMSSMTERPGCYAAPLLPTFRQQVLDTWGQEWQGFAGVDSQVPGEEQLLRPLVGSKGLLVLAPGRLLGHVATQAVAGLDLSNCTAAVLLDRLDNSAAAAHQIKSDNRKTESERTLEGPCQTTQLLMLRGVRAVALAALPGTPHTHVHLAANMLRGLTGSPIQPLQVPDSSTASSTTSSTSGAAAAAAAAAAAGGAGCAAGGTSDFILPTSTGPLTLGEAVVVAQRQGLAGFELQALREAGVVVYGLAGVVAAEGGSGGGKAKTQPRHSARAEQVCRLSAHGLIISTLKVCRLVIKKGWWCVG